MAAFWTDEESMKFIKQWGKKGTQKTVRGSKKRTNNHVYEKFSGALAKEGMSKNGEQCRTKVKKLRQNYKKIKENHIVFQLIGVYWKRLDDGG